MSNAVLSKSFSAQPLPGSGFELVQSIEADYRLLDAVDTSSLYADLARSGVLIYRDFRTSLDDFNEFVGRHSSRVTLDPARKSSTPNTAEIAAGSFEMGLHRENGNLPFSPDLQWFYCLEPARKGSETTICDGRRVLYELSGAVRRLFERKKIKYSRRIPWSNVRRFLSVELQILFEAVDDSHLELVNGRVQGQRYRRIDDQLIESELTTSAIIDSRFSGKAAFCNSLLGPSFNYEPPRITWDTGEDIDFEVWDDIKAASERCTHDMFWRQGDVVVLDNSRVMHGRRRVADPGRRIFGAQSYRKEVSA